jgi:hypothetical protein
MSKSEPLSNLWNDVADEIRALGGSIRPGSVCAQNVKYRAKDGTRKSHGPYPILTFKEKGKTRTIRLESSEQEEIVRKQIANFRQLKQLVKRLIEIGMEMADAEVAEKSDAKKNSSNASRSSGKGKRPRSWNA